MIPLNNYFWYKCGTKAILPEGVQSDIKKGDRHSYQNADGRYDQGDHLPQHRFFQEIDGLIFFCESLELQPQEWCLFNHNAAKLPLGYSMILIIGSCMIFSVLSLKLNYVPTPFITQKLSY